MNELMIIGIAMLLSAFFSGTEIAVIGLNPMSLVQGNYKKLALLLKLKEKLVSFCLVGNNLTIVTATLALDQYLIDEQSLLIKLSFFGAQVMLFFLLAELVPKAVFLRTNTLALSALFYPIMLLYGLLYPLTILFYQLNNVLKRVFPSQEPTQSEEVFHFVGSSIDNPEALDITGGLLKLEKLKIRELMTPFPDLYILDEEDTIKDGLSVIEDSTYSRYPIYQERTDNITGYVTVEDLIKNLPSKRINQFKKELAFVPENLPVDKALSKMKNEGQPLLMVVDEYGASEGIVTMEDIAEVMLGDIRSGEQKQEIAEIEMQDNGFRLQASIDLHDFNDYFQCSLKKQDFDTLGGFVMSKLEQIPEQGTELDLEIGKLVVLESDKRTLKTLLFIPVQNVVN